jgi:hypothetical protein
VEGAIIIVNSPVGVGLCDELSHLESFFASIGKVQFSPSRKHLAPGCATVRLMEIDHTLNDMRLSDLIADAMPALKIHAKQGKEASFELMKLAKSLRDSAHFSDVKEAFLASLNSLHDFERYLILRLNYSDELTTSDDEFVAKRFSDLYPGQDLSYIEELEYYEHEYDDGFSDLHDDDWSRDAFDEERENEQRKRDPNEIIADLFDSLCS